MDKISAFFLLSLLLVCHEYNFNYIKRVFFNGALLTCFIAREFYLKHGTTNLPRRFKLISISDVAYLIKELYIIFSIDVNSKIVYQYNNDEEINI